MSEAKSESLLRAMLRVQEEAPVLPKDAINPHFNSKYTPLDTIVETIGPILSKHGLVWMTLPGTDEHGNPALHYRLAHVETTQALEGAMPLLLTKQDPQGMGSALTYARRYSLCAVLNLVADDDDDGNAGSAGGSEKATGDSNVPVSDKQHDFLDRLIGEHIPADAQSKVRAWADDTLTGGRNGTCSKALDGLKNDTAATVERLVKAATEWHEGQSDIPADDTDLSTLSSSFMDVDEHLAEQTTIGGD